MNIKEQKIKFDLIGVGIRKLNIKKIVIQRAISVLLMLAMTAQAFPAGITFAQEKEGSLEASIEDLAKASASADFYEKNEILNILSEETGQSLNSAYIKLKPWVRSLYKKTFQSKEEIKVVIQNVYEDNFSVKVLNNTGEEEKKVKVKSEQIANQMIVTLETGSTMIPGEYTVQVVDESGKIISAQDFSWGVLALNTNKATFAVDETAKIHMAVLDETGLMVCDAKLELKITASNQTETILSTENGEIKVNDSCHIKGVTEEPDYETEYKVGQEGFYMMELTAITDNGVYSVDDSFAVNNSALFDVERVTATRIFPTADYEVNIKVRANKDFSGLIAERVPSSFRIYGSEGSSEGDFKLVRKEQIDSEQEVLAAVDKRLIAPVKDTSELTGLFGDQLHDPLLKEKYQKYGVSGHDGIDFVVPGGTEVFAVDDGTVALAQIDGDYGTTLVIQHEWGKSYYGHLSSFETKLGDKVKQGELVAKSGNTGLSTAPHLHFGIKLNENDPNNGYFGKIDPSGLIGLKQSIPSVLGASTNEESSKVIVWEKELKKGEEVTLSYMYDSPDTSPQFYKLGPLEFFEQKEEEINREKLVFAEGREWQIAVDAVVVSGGITSTEAQFGGLQRKVVYVNSNWYAFYNDGGNVTYKKSADGLTWGSAVDMDSADAGVDDYNPTIDVSGDFIHVFWVDDGAETLEGKRINTASADAQGTICTTSSLGTIGSSFTVSISALSTTSVVAAFSDTSSDTEVDMFEITGMDGTCTVTDVHPGNVMFGTQNSGITAGDKPVVVGLDSTTAMMMFQNGTTLKSARYDATLDEWRRNNQNVTASDTNTQYSATTDGTNTWLLSASSTSTNLYHHPKASTGIIESAAIDGDVGASGDEQDTEMDISCPTADNCKIVYVDNLDTAGPDLVFVDCNDATCSAPTLTVLDTDTGSATITSSPSIFCVASDNCKIVYGDTLGGTSPDFVFRDCANEACSSSTATIIDADLGGNTSKPNGAIYCLSDTDCQLTFFDDATDDLWIADCSNATCSTRNTLAAIKLNINTTNSNARNSIWCPTSGDCKILYHDAALGDLIFFDCSATTCASGTTTTIDNDVGGTAVNVPNSVDCTGGATECRLLYSDGSQTETNFVDCNASAACASATITTIDATSGGLVTFGLDLDCSNGISDCKGVYVGNTTGGSEDQYVFDCDNDTCTSGSVSNMDDPPTRAAIDCPATDDCKLAYIELVAGVPQLSFADCTNEDCLPEWEALTAPWTSETGITSVSLTYDSTNSDLIANIIKDTTEQAYYRVSDATTISWGTSTAYDFTAGDMDNISTPETAAGTTLMGALVRQGSNIEFDLFSSGSAPAITTNGVPFNNERTLDTTPSFEFTGTDADSDDLIYQIQIDDNYDFSSVVVNCVSNAACATGSGTFENTVDGLDTNPFTEGQKMRFTPSTTLTSGVTYYWRVNADDASQTTDWSTVQSFTVNTGVSQSDWFQTTDEQFATGTLTDTVTSGSDSVGLDTGSITRVGTATAITPAFDTSVAYVLPSGIQDGDVAVAVLHREATGAVTVPSGEGYTELDTQDSESGAGSTLSLTYYYTVLQAADSSQTHTFTFANTWRTGFLIVLRGVDTTEPRAIVNPVAATQAASGTTLDTPAEADPGVDRMWVFWIASSWDNATKSMPATVDGYAVTRELGSASANLGVFWAEYTTSSAISAATVTYSNTLETKMAKTLAFKPAAGSSGTVMSPEVDYDSVTGASTWGDFIWTEDETNGSVSVQLYYTVSTACDTIVPDGALSGNSSGFTTSPIDISGLNTTTYNRICMRASLTNSSGTPYLEDWTVTWSSGSETPNLSQLMRHGKWFNSSGVRQPFTF